MSNIVRLGPTYFPATDKGKPVSNGSIYVGEPDTDPEIVGNQKQVSALQEDTTTVEISQPISTNAGGTPTYNGSPVTLLVEGRYSLKVLDSKGAQVYYVPDTPLPNAATARKFLSDYDGSMSDAITDIGVTETTLVIDVQPDIIQIGITSPATLTIDLWAPFYFEDDGNNANFNILGTFLVAPKQYAFNWGNGIGLVTFGINSVGTVYTQWFGAIADGVTDDTTVIQQAIDAATDTVSKVKLTAGTYLVSDIGTTGFVLTLPSNFTLEGEGYNNTTILMDDNTDIYAIYATGQDNITVKDFKIDGNKANQTDNTQADGIKFLEGLNLTFENLWIHDTRGHGIHVNNGAILDTDQKMTIKGCRFTDCGWARDDTYGSNLAITDGNGVTISDFHSSGTAKAGLRFSGKNYTITNFVIHDCGNGGLVPVSGDFSDSTISNGVSYDSSGTHGNEDGIHFLDIERVTISNVVCYGNKGAGILLVNGCSDITINGCILYNNGQSAQSITAITGRDGITIKDEGNGNENIIITNCIFLDNQGTPTQDYGILVQDNSDNILIANNMFRSAQVSGLYTDTESNTLVVRDNQGLSEIIDGTVTETVTGTVNKTDMSTITISANEVPKFGIIKIRASGTFSGANDTKTIRLEIGSEVLDGISADAGSEDKWTLEAEVTIVNAAKTQQRIWVRTWEGIVMDINSFDTATEDMTSDMIIKITGQLAHTDDSIVQRYWEVTRVK